MEIHGFWIQNELKINKGGEWMALIDKLKHILTSERRKKADSDAQKSKIYPFGKELNITTEEKKKRISLLTQREYELYMLLLEGFTLKESANQLFIKYSTANTHMTGIYKKLGVNSRAELIINYRHIKVANNKDP